MWVRVRWYWLYNPGLDVSSCSHQGQAEGRSCEGLSVGEGCGLHIILGRRSITNSWRRGAGRGWANYSNQMRRIFLVEHDMMTWLYDMTGHDMMTRSSCHESSFVVRLAQWFCEAVGPTQSLPIWVLSSRPRDVARPADSGQIMLNFSESRGGQQTPWPTTYYGAGDTG